ncbi:MAG: hypothetical protein IK143_03110 [Bacteroidales bacterium]|nr:hypothetical protein [Bacteroidales bacterium]
MSINHISCRLLTATSIFGLALFAISCSPEALKDDADDFVGIYKASVIENVRWGSDSGTLTPTGTFYISKVSANRVQVTGYINTYGEVNGKTVYFESMYDSDSEGYITTVFQQGILNGNVLTFSTTSTGQLKYNGKMYPYSATSSWTAIRQQ